MCLVQVRLQYLYCDQEKTCLPNGGQVFCWCVANSLVLRFFAASKNSRRFGKAQCRNKSSASYFCFKQAEEALADVLSPRLEKYL